jgi:hypothetical protein
MTNGSRLRGNVAVEKRLAPEPAVQPLGTIELHALKGWPPAHGSLASCQPCSEHGPTCAVSITSVSGRLRRIILLEGSECVPLG